MAEVLGIAASIVGIVSLTLQVVDKFREICELSEQKDAENRDLAESLTHSAIVLHDVESLMTRVQESRLESRSSLVLSTLMAQLKAYKEQIQHWSLEGQLLRPSEAVDKPAGRRRDTFAKLIPRSMGTRSGQRVALIRTQLEKFEVRIHGTLEILGRELDLSAATKLDFMSQDITTLPTQISNTINKRTNDMCKFVSIETNHIVETLSTLSNSTSSISARSRSTDERLRDVQFDMSSMHAELRSFKEAFLDYMSSNSSSGSAQEGASGSSGSMPSNIIQGTGGSPNSDYHRGNKIGLSFLPLGDRDRNPQKDPAQGKSQLVVNYQSNSELSQGSGSDASHDTEFRAIFNATDLIVQATRAMYPLHVSKYVVMLSAWRLLLTLQMAAVEEASRTGLPEPAAQRQRIDKRIERVSRHLLTQRKICCREESKDFMESVEKSFQIDDEVVAKWSEIGARGQRRMPLGLTTLQTTPAEIKQDRLLRINAWLFDMLELSPDLILLHRSIFKFLDQRAMSQQVVFNKLIETERNTGVGNFIPEPHQKTSVLDEKASDSDQKTSALDEKTSDSDQTTSVPDQTTPASDQKKPPPNQTKSALDRSTVLNDAFLAGGETWKGQMLELWLLDDAAIDATHGNAGSIIPESEATVMPDEVDIEWLETQVISKTLVIDNEDTKLVKELQKNTVSLFRFEKGFHRVDKASRSSSQDQRQRALGALTAYQNSEEPVVKAMEFLSLETEVPQASSARVRVKGSKATHN